MFGKISLALVTATSLFACVDNLSADETEVKVPDALKELRADYARYHDLANAAADGFALGINGGVKACVANPNPAVGAMGYHYGNQARFDDPTIDEMAPEVLVYHTGDDGALELGAVEWVVPKVKWEAVHGAGAPAPTVYGTKMVVLNPVLNWYVAHAWLYEANPTATMSNWNPAVTCP